MKKIISVFIATSFLMTACGGLNEDSDYFEELNTENTVEETTIIEEEETNTNIEESAASNSDSETTTTENEEEAYVLDFDAKTFDGKSINSEIFQNSKLTMINVWGTFCGPCLNEMPDLAEISKEYGKDEFQLLGIVADVVEGSDEKAINDVKEIVEMTGADYPQILLNEDLHIKLVGASDSVPTTYFFNNKGELLGYIVGARSKDDWKGLIDEILLEL